MDYRTLQRAKDQPGLEDSTSQGRAIWETQGFGHHHGLRIRGFIIECRMHRVFSDKTEMETLLDGKGRAKIWQKLVLICLIEHKSKMVNDFIHDADNEAIHVESIYWDLADMMPGLYGKLVNDQIVRGE
jgi:hypothetical protein